MTVFMGSRYNGSKLSVDREGIKYMQFRKAKYVNKEEDFVVRFKKGDRLDLIAERYYEDSQLMWVILDANPGYYSPEDIKVGDFIVIPNPERVNE